MNFEEILDKLLGQKNVLFAAFERYCDEHRIKSSLQGKAADSNSESTFKELNGIEFVIGYDRFLLTAEFRNYDGGNCCNYFQTYKFVQQTEEFPRWNLEKLDELDMINDLYNETKFKSPKTKTFKPRIGADEEKSVNDITESFGDEYIYQLKKMVWNNIKSL